MGTSANLLVVQGGAKGCHPVRCSLIKNFEVLNQKARFSASFLIVAPLLFRVPSERQPHAW